MLGSNKPVITENDIWCSAPQAPTDRVKPSPEKIAKGFRYAEIPKHSTFNWAGNIISEYMVHVNQRGISEWDVNTPYQTGALTLDDNQIWIASTGNAGTKPGTGTGNPWRKFYENLSDFRDVDIDTTTLGDGDIIRQVLYDIEDTTVPFYRMWENIPGTSILKLKELNDVFGGEADGSILFKMDSTNNDDVYAVIPSSYLINYINFENYTDVDNTPGNWDKGDTLTWSGGAWSGVPTEGYVEWDDILFRRDYFNPIETDANTIGGFRAKFDNTSGAAELELFSSALPTPGVPVNVTAGLDETNRVKISWQDDGTFSPTSFIVYRDDKYLYETPDGTTTTYYDTSGIINKVYKYHIIAKNADGSSAPSNSAYGARTDKLPSPVGLKASQNVSASIITLSWENVDYAMGYNLYRKKQGETNYTYVAGGISSPWYQYELSNTTAEYYVVAVNPAAIESNPSNITVGKTTATPGNKVYQHGGTFSIPNGISYLKIDMQGAGGAGSVGAADNYHSGGGYAGEFKSKVIDVTDVTSINVDNGVGGVPVNGDYTTPGNGGTGGDALLTIYYSGSDTPLLAKGGRGGDYRTNDYQGNGKEKLSAATGLYYKDGLHSDKPALVSCFGGEASAFSNGGSRSGQVPGPGAGGSAVSNAEKDYDNPSFCNGGDSIVVFSWGDIDINQASEPEDTSLLEVATDMNREFVIATDLQEMFPNREIKDFEMQAKINQRERGN